MIDYNSALLLINLRPNKNEVEVQIGINIIISFEQYIQNCSIK